MGGLGWQEVVVLASLAIPTACVVVFALWLQQDVNRLGGNGRVFAGAWMFVALLVLFVPNPFLILALTVFALIAYRQFRDNL